MCIVWVVWVVWVSGNDNGKRQKCSWEELGRAKEKCLLLCDNQRLISLEVLTSEPLKEQIEFGAQLRLSRKG